MPKNKLDEANRRLRRAMGRKPLDLVEMGDAIAAQKAAMEEFLAEEDAKLAADLRRISTDRRKAIRRIRK